MQHQTIARRYATAVFSLAKSAGVIDAVQHDLTAASDAILGDETTRRFFVSPVIDRKAKAALIESSLGERFGEIALHTILLLIRKRREAMLGPIVREYARLVMLEKGKEPLEIVSARPLSPDDLAAMVARLAAKYGKDFDVTERVDPDLLGGVRITMGDRRIDGSLAGRLDELSRTLFANLPHAVNGAGNHN
jgi:F-type H+-transporting ATPase subunit delta